MARLTAARRARLPDSAFAYVDAMGRWCSPIHDEPHVRHALARFERVAFEDDAARGSAVAELPGGKVTFSRSDIEGSTRLLRSLRDAYPGMC